MSIQGAALHHRAGRHVAQVSITFNKRTYRFDCGEADAPRLEKIAAYLKEKLEALIREHGTVGDERLMLMAALTLTDELFEARADIDELLQEETGKLKSLADSIKGMKLPASADPLRKTGG